MLADDIGLVTYASPAILNMLGKTRADCIGQALGDCLTPDSRSAVDRALDTCLAQPAVAMPVAMQALHADATARAGGWKAASRTC